MKGFLVAGVMLLALTVHAERESVLVAPVVPLTVGANGSDLHLGNEARTRTKMVGLELYVDGVRVDYSTIILPPKSFRTIKIRQDEFASYSPDRVSLAIRGIDDLASVVAGLKRLYGGIEYFSFLSPWTTWSSSFLRETPLRSVYAVGIAAAGGKPFDTTVSLLDSGGKVLTKKTLNMVPGTQDARYLWQYFFKDYQSWADFIGEDREVTLLVTCIEGKVAVNTARVDFSSFPH